MYSARAFLTVLATLALIALGPGPLPAQTAAQPVIPRDIAQRLDPGQIARVRRLAERGDAQAQYLLFAHYMTHPRRGEPPWESGDRLVSRAEAEAALRGAAERGHEPALAALTRLLLEGGPVRRDPRAAILLLEPALGGPDDAQGAVSARMAAAMAALPDPGAQVQQRAGDLAAEALARGDLPAVRTRAAMLALSDPAAARALLESALGAGNRFAEMPLAAMLIDGTGGPPDQARAGRLLSRPVDAAAAAALGRQHLPGGILPRMPRRAIELMAVQAETDPATRADLAVLLKTWRVKLDNDAYLHQRMLEDADLNLPGAALNVLNLHKIHREGFRSMTAWFDLVPRFAADDPEIALFHADMLAGFARASKDVARQRFETQVREILTRLEARNIPGAFRLHGQYVMGGLIFRQDSAAAVRLLHKAAELGDVEAMMELADAIDTGTGTAKDTQTAIAWMRQAAAQGSFDARRELARRFSLLSRANGVTLREGITNRVAMYGDGMDVTGAMSMSSLFIGAEMSGLEAGQILAPFYDGFRISPAAAEDRMLVPLVKNTPKWIWQATETILVHYNYWQGDPQGHMGPEAREAFRKFIADAGPMSY